jgi:predicted peptidase
MPFRAIVSVMVLLLVGVACASGQSTSGEQKAVSWGQSEQMFQKQITKTVSLRYLLYLPKDYGRKEQTWPLMLFLHGAGERGDDLALVRKHGPPKLVEQGQDLPFIIVSPQCSAGTWWTEEMDALMALLDEVQSKYAVDPNRVYLTGLSMGGYGSWALACRHPERFAAVAPICGGGERHLARNLKDVPVWAFHGAKDPVVPLKESQEMVDALKQARGDVRLTIYPDAEHDCWTETYNNPKLYEWFLSHRKNEPSK